MSSFLPLIFRLMQLSSRKLRIEIFPAVETFWLVMYASPLSRWASSELNYWSKPSSLLLRV